MHFMTGFASFKRWVFPSFEAEKTCNKMYTDNFLLVVIVIVKQKDCNFQIQPFLINRTLECPNSKYSVCSLDAFFECEMMSRPKTY